MRQGLGIKLIHWTSIIQAVFAIGLLFWQSFYGPGSFTVLRGTLAGLDLDLTFKIDALSTLLFSMVSVIAMIISQYSLRYLDGEERQYYFYKYLIFTVTSVSVLVLSSNLMMFFIAWCLTSTGLHKLLLFFENRTQAVLAARKKIIISRIGDLMLLVAFVLTYKTFGTLEFDAMFAKAADMTFAADHSFAISAIGVLFAGGALTKSAQFPFHFWLPETMETPTPVSALMHAGIINAGGFLIIRLSPIMTHAELPHLLLTIAGAITAVYGALVMITQNDIKKKLAYSTVSQMGLMIFACGLGAYSIALFHMVAHSFYKAYAFLSTGDLIIESKKSSLQLLPFGGLYTLFVAVIAGGIVFWGATVSRGLYLPYFTYAAILLMALMQCIVSLPKKNFSRVQFFGNISGLMLIAALIYGLIELYFKTNLADIVADTTDPITFASPAFVVAILSVGIFSIGFYLAGQLYTSRYPWSRRMYVNLWNGSYFGAKSTRILTRVWPV